MSVRIYGDFTDFAVTVRNVIVYDYILRKNNGRTRPLLTKVGTPSQRYNVPDYKSATIVQQCRLVSQN